MPMKVHGEWQITLVRNVLVQTIAGAFNVEGALARSGELRSHAPADGPWATLGNSANWDMGNASTLAIVDDTRQWMLEHGCVCIATVVPPGLRQSIHRKNTRALPPDVLKYCATLGEACAWLTERGFALAVDEYPHREFLRRTARGT
jgi:hypothetical protein